MSKDRTTHISDLTEVEAIEMKSELQAIFNVKFPNERTKKAADKIQADKMRKKIISHAYTIGWVDGIGKCDYKRLEGWMLKYSELHKSMNKYTIDELPRLVTQFKKITK